MNLSKQPATVLVTGLVIGTAALTYLGVNTGPLSNINEWNTSGVSRSGNTANSGTDTDNGNESVPPSDQETKHSDIINERE